MEDSGSWHMHKSRYKCTMRASSHFSQDLESCRQVGSEEVAEYCRSIRCPLVETSAKVYDTHLPHSTFSVLLFVSCSSSIHVQLFLSWGTLRMQLAIVSLSSVLQTGLNVSAGFQTLMDRISELQPSKFRDSTTIPKLHVCETEDKKKCVISWKFLLVLYHTLCFFNFAIFYTIRVCITLFLTACPAGWKKY